MGCSNCGRENRADSRFCDACGTPLVLRCGACDRELNPDARFCDGCGTPTGGVAGPPAPSRPVPASTAAVRKTVTVLFCDLVGSTAFAEAVDPESAREAMGRYHAMARATVEENGGTVAKFIGDGVMALFGVPEVAEDDAERAVLTGRALQRRFVPIREHIATRYGVEVGLRVGINTGEVVIDDTDADLVGDVLNTAARLEAECSPGEVLVGEDTWRLTRNLLDYRALGEVTVKGKRDGLPTFQLVTSDDAATEPAATDHAEAAIPFVGRDTEIGQLRAVLDDAITAREARLTTVIGSPGVGKTRLARELGRAAGDDARFVELRCERAGTATFAPIAELLQTVADFDDDAAPDEIVEAVRRFVGEADDAVRLVELLGSFVGTASPRSTEDTFFAVRRLVELLGERQPLVLVIDDIQWAEPLFLDLLEHLAQWARASPVMIIGLARPEIRDIRPPLAETGRRVSAVVSLEGLDAAATERLAAELLGGSELPPELTARLPESTDGNPLFVRELVRMLVDDGVIVQIGDHWELAVDAEAIEVPPTIQSLLATRVERLPHSERRVLELASVVGSEFPLGALAALLPETQGDDLDTVIERLRRKEQVEPTGTYWGDEPVLRFHHVLIRDAAYRRLLKGARADLHLEVGAWMEATSEHLTGDFDVVIAHHFEQAYLYRQQLNDEGANTTAAGRKAALLLRRAADAALQRDDLAAAGGYANRALATLDTDADEMPDLLLLACEASLSSGDVGNGRALVKRLGDHAVGDDRLEAWTTCFEAELSVLTEPDELRAASDRAADAAAQLQHLGDQAGVAKARIIRAGALARLGQVGAAEGELDLALTAARAAHDRRRITAVLSAAPRAALWGPSPVPRAGGRCLDVVRLSRITADSPEVEATSVRCQAVLEALRGRFDTARSLLATARATTEKIGLRQGLLETRYFAGIVELLAGDPVAAEPHLRRAFGGLGQLGIGADAGQAAAYLARALLLQGRLDEADELAADSDALAGQNLQTAIAARSAQAEILAVRGETVEALVLAEEAVRLAADTDIIFDHANALATLARVRAAHGDRDGAERAAASAGELFHQKGATALVETTSAPSPAPAGPAQQAATTDASSPVAAAPWNHADACSLRAGASFNTRDISGYAAFVDESFTGFDHRRMLRHPIASKTEWLEMFREMFTLTEGAILASREPVASRGDRLAIIRWSYRLEDDPDGPLIEGLELIDYLPNGQLARSSLYDIDDLRAAIEELDEWYLDSIDAASNPSAFSLLASDRATTARRSEDMLRGFHRDIELIDRRALGWGTLSGRKAARERVGSWSIIPDGFVAYTPRVHRATEQCALYETSFRVDGADGDVSDSRFLVVSRLEPGSGQVTHWEQFEHDDLDAAAARFEGLVAAEDGLRVNDSIRTGTVASYLSHLGSTGELRRVVADDFVADGAGLAIVTRSDIVDGRVPTGAIGFGVEYRRVVSVIGERLAMLFVEVDGGERRWSVEEIDERGRLARVRHFPADSLIEATNHLEERWQAIEDAPAAVAVRHHYGVAARSAKAEMAGLLADDFVLVDHRPLGLGRLDRAAMVSFNAQDNQGELGELIPLELHAASDRIVLVSSAVVAVTDAGELWESLVCTVLFVSRDGLVERIELFDEDDVDDAMTRAAEIDPEVFAAPTTRTSEPADRPWNRADGWARRHIRLMEAGDLDAMASAFHPDVVLRDRRPMMEKTIEGRDDALAVLAAAHEATGGRVKIEHEPIAARGDLFLLRRARWRRLDEQDGPFVDMVDVLEYGADGRLRAVSGYQWSDLAVAVHELDRHYLGSLSPDPFFVLSILTDHALMERRGTALLDILHPDIEMIDNRSIGWGRTIGRDQVRSRIESIAELPEEMAYYVPRLLRSSALTGLFEGTMRVTGDEGGESNSTYLGVSRSDPANGLATLWEQFEVDDLVGATARFDELVAADAGLLTNRAVVTGGLANALILMGERDQLTNLLADGFMADRKAAGESLITCDELVDGAVDPAAVGLGVEYRHVISIVGESLALLLVDTDVGRRWSVEELDEFGRLRRIEHFALDALHAATAHLAERQEALGPTNEVIRTVNRFFAAYEAGDHEKVAGLLDDGFVLVDHRPLGGNISRANMIRFAAEGLDTGLGVLLGRRTRQTSTRVVVGDSMTLAVSDEGEVLESNPAVAVTEADGGRIIRFELFPDHELDAALARAAELDPEGFDGVTETDLDEHQPWNEADRLHRQLTLALEVSDITAWRRLIADEIRVDDRRALLRHELGGRSEIETFYDGWQNGPHRCTVTTVATRGDDLVLLDMRWTPADDPAGPTLEHLQLNRWDSSQLVECVTFDPDDLRAALDELDRLFLATLDPVTAGEHRHTFRFLNHLSDGELEPVMIVQRPDTRMVDHRPLGWGEELGYDELRERFRTLTDPNGSITEFVRRFHFWAPQLICIAIRIVNTSAEGAQFIDDHIVVSRIDPATGFGMRMDQFADEQLDEALTFVDVTMAEIDAQLPRANLAVRAGVVANVAARSAVLDDLLAILADDFVAALADGRTITIDDIRSGRVAPTEIGFGVTDRRIEDAIVDRVALLTVALPGDGRRVWSIEMLDPTGRIAEITHIAIDQPAAANREYHVRAHQFAEAGPYPTLLRFVIASQDRNAAAIRDVLAPSFSFADHRQLGFGRADRDTYVDLQATPPSDDPDETTALRMPRIEALTEQLAVVRFRRVYLTPEGESWEASRGISVNLIRGGVQHVVELFADDQLEAALARAAELDPEGFGSTASYASDDEPVPWNRADRLNRIASGHFFAARIDEWAAMIADGYRGEQRRELLGHDFTTKQDLVAANRAMLELSSAPVAEIETLATRGDDLVLTRLRVTPADDPDGALIDVLDLTQWNDDDRCVRTVTFDVDDVLAAIDELDRLYLPECEPVLRAYIMAVRRIDRAMMNNDLDVLVAAVHPDVDFIDNRALGFGDISGADGYADRLRTLIESADEFTCYLRRIHRADPTCPVIGVHVDLASPAGAVSVNGHILVHLFDPGSGLGTRVEQFEPNDVVVALGRATALASECALALHSPASQLVGFANLAVRMGTLDDFLALLADDFVASGAGSGRASATVAELRSGAVSPADLGFGGHDRKVVAVRGERLVLVQVGALESSGVARHWSLAELDDDHRIVRIQTFDDDDLLGAVNALEERSRRLSEPPRVPDTIWRWEEAHRNLGVDALARLTADDFELVDHRPRGYGPMGKTDSMAIVLAGIDDDSLRGVPVHSAIHPTGSASCVQEGALWMRRESDHWTGDPFIAVTTCRDDAVNRIELFAEDQLDDALARAAELETATVENHQVISAVGRGTRLAIVSAGTERHWAVQLLGTGGAVESTIDFPIADTSAALDAYHSELATRERVGEATDVVLRYVQAVRHGDRERLTRLIEPRCEMVDHRPLGYGRLDRPGLIEMVLTPATDDDRGLMLVTGEIRTEGSVGVISFTRVFLTEEGAYWEAAGGLVTALAHDGRAVRYDLYAEDDLDDALAQAARFEPAFAGADAPNQPAGWYYDGTIDPVWLAERSELEVRTTDSTLRFVDAVASGDADALDKILAPAFSTDDHRPIGWGPRTREEFVEAVRQRPATLGTGIASGRILLNIGKVALALYEVTTPAPDVGGEITEVGLGVMIAADGLVTWMELFGERDLDAAVVRSRELASLHSPGPTNRADRFARRRSERIGAAEAELETVLVRADDYVLHRHTNPATPDHPRYVVSRWSANGELIGHEGFDTLRDAETHVDTESIGSLDPAVFPGAVIIEWGRVTRLRDWESAAQLLAPEYRATSDQYLQSGGTVDRDQLLEWFGVEADPAHRRELIATELHAVSSLGIVFDEVDFYIDGDGESFESGGAALIIVRDGLLASAEKRDNDKLPELLDELDRRAADDGVPVAYLSETARALRSGRRSSRTE